MQSQGGQLARHERLGRAEDAWLASIETLRPARSISTADCAEQERWLKAKDLEKPQKFHHAIAPYLRGIEDACDEPGVTVVGVKGPARGLKTTAAENRVFRNWLYGPSYDVIWYMQSKDDVEEYCEERLEPMLRMHDVINQHVNWRDRRHSLTRKRIRGSLARFLAATPGSLRSKTAPIIIGDEIDGYAKRIRKGFLSMAKARQQEHGIAGLLYVCSHPDEGPDDGIDVVLRQSLLHLWYWNCVHCRKASSPAVEAEVRMTWNVPQLMEDVEDLDLNQLLEMVEAKACLICPHCQGHIDNQQRLKMSAEGTWLQPGQELTKDGEITGARRMQRTMGFVIHAMMSPWTNIGMLARDYVANKIVADETQDTSGLKEFVCKFLGETFSGADEMDQMEDCKVLQGRLTDPGYSMGEVPRGVRFLVAFVDIQGDRFEVRVIGYGAGNESWVIDSFAIKQPPQDQAAGTRAFQNIDPANRIGDWDVIEDAVINQSYPMAGNDIRRQNGLPEMFLPIAKTMVDAHGQPGVHLNSVRWVANLTNPARMAADKLAGRTTPRRPVELYRVQLIHGDAKPTGEPTKRVKAHLNDDKGQKLPHQVYERTINVHHYKLIVSRRMKIAEPGPGRIHYPNNMPIRYFREAAAERLINDEWIPFGRNEQWDGHVLCEAGKDLLDPDRPDMDWKNPPIWATPLRRGGRGDSAMPDESVAPTPKSRYDRLLEVAGREDADPDEDDDDQLGVPE